MPTPHPITDVLDLAATIIPRRWRLRNVGTVDDLIAWNTVEVDRQFIKYGYGTPDRRRIRAVSALNRIGVLTMGNQCGTVGIENDQFVERRAAVEMLLTHLERKRIEAWLASCPDLRAEWTVTKTFEPSSVGSRPAEGCEVIRVGDTPTRRMGEQLDARGLHRRFPVRAELLPELAGRWQGTLFAADWGTNHLFDHLLAFAATHGAPCVGSNS